VTFVILVLAFAIERILTKPKSSVPTDLKLALGGIQFLALIPSISSRWPKTLFGLLNTLSLSNLEIDLFAPECSVPMTFWNKYMLKVLLPFILLGFLALIIMAKLILARLLRRTPSVPLSKDTLLNRSISMFLVGVSSLYTFLTSAALSPFACTSIGNSRSVLVRSPNIPCYEGEWTQKLLTMIFFVFIYFVSFPLGILSVLVMKHSDTNDSKFQERFGHFVHGYRWSYSYWHVVILLKNLSISALIQYLSSSQDDSGGSFATLIVLFLFILLNIICMPYRQINDMIHSCIWIFLLVVLMSSNTIVFSKENVSPTSRLITEALSVFFICLALLWLVYRMVSISIKLSKVLNNQPDNSQSVYCINHDQIQPNVPIHVPLNSKMLDQIILLPKKHLLDRCKALDLEAKGVYLLVSHSDPSCSVIAGQVEIPGASFQSSQVTTPKVLALKDL
jgi:hypothetical protein